MSKLLKKGLIDVCIDCNNGLQFALGFGLCLAISALEEEGCDDCMQSGRSQKGGKPIQNKGRLL